MSPNHVIVDLTPSEKVTAHQDAENIEIAFDWFNENHMISAIYCCISGFFVYLEPAVLVTTGGLSAQIFSGICLLLALFWAYHTLTGFFNQTAVTVTEQSLEVTYGPLPWLLRDRLYQFGSIDAVFFDADKTAMTWRHNHPAIFYAVYVVSEGKTIPIIRYIESALVAAYLTTQIQTALGQVTKPYWQILLDDLDYHGADRPLFKAEKRLPYPPTQIGDAIEELLRRQYRSKLLIFRPPRKGFAVRMVKA